MNSQISSNTTLAHAEGLAQFAWLAAELAAAAARNDAVHILGHQYGTIPPAFSYLMLVPPPVTGVVCVQPTSVSSQESVATEPRLYADNCTVRVAVPIMMTS